MEIITYTIGVLIGLVPILVDLGPSRAPAQVILDGKTVCSVTAEAPGCVADLGTAPRIHLLELARGGEGGAAAERVTSWINRPGVRAEVHASIDCDAAKRACELRISWGHPLKLDPSRVIVTLDGRTESFPARSFVRSVFPGSSPPQVATVEAVFEDGARAIETRLLQGSYPESAEASLHAVPLMLAPGPPVPDLGERLARAGWRVHSVDRGSATIAFVVQPFSLSDWQRNPAQIRAARAAAPSRPADRIEEVAANETLSSFNYGESSPIRGAEWMAGLFRIDQVPSRRFRIADAVAAAGFVLGGTSGRRAVVLILGDPVDDQSAFSAEEVRRYLREAFVPLIVWRAGAVARDGWPEGTLVSTPSELVREANFLPLALDRQRIAWLEGRLDPRDFRPRLPEGVEIAGREEEPAAGSDIRAASPESPPAAEPVPSGRGDRGLEDQMVLALAADPEHGRMYASTDQGLFRRDGNGGWQAIPFGKSPSAVNAVTIRGGSVFASGSAGIIRSTDGEGRRFTFSPMPPSVCVAADASPAGPLLASTRGSLVRSVDGGASWRLAEKGLERNFVVVLAADPKRPGAFWAGTAGQGIFRTSDGGAKWSRASSLLERSAIRAIVLDPLTRAIWAGTDEGVFRGDAAGKKWELLRAGMPRAPVYAIALDPSDPSVVLAGTPAGLFARVGESPWKRIDEAPGHVTAVAVDRERRVFVGTARDGVFVDRFLR